MKPLILVFFFIFISLMTYGQFRKQIGTSVWVKKNEVFVDSTISYIISYDKEGHKIQEWQIFLDTSGRIIDTNIVDLDTVGRAIHLYSGKEHWYYEYDSLGTRTKCVAYRLNDTINIIIHPVYRNGKLIQTTMSYNNQSFSDTIVYEYHDSTTIENQGGGEIIETRIRNSLGQTIHSKIETNYNDQKSTTIIKYEIDDKGHVVLYSKVIDGNEAKKTTHFFKDGFEQSQFEQYFNPEYSVITLFKYEFWN